MQQRFLRPLPQALHPMPDISRGGCTPHQSQFTTTAATKPAAEQPTPDAAVTLTRAAAD